jgi:hypothetical protein
VGDAGSTPAPVPHLKPNQMSTEANDAAFARSHASTNETLNGNGSAGLTKREYFAAIAMQGFLMIAKNEDSLQFLARQSVKMADFLIQELNKEINQQAHKQINQNPPIV